MMCFYFPSFKYGFFTLQPESLYPGIHNKNFVLNQEISQADNLHPDHFNQKQIPTSTTPAKGVLKSVHWKYTSDTPLFKEQSLPEQLGSVINKKKRHFQNKFQIEFQPM